MNNKTPTTEAKKLLDQLFGVALENPFGDCDECKWYNCWSEHHPYGSTTAEERICVCQNNTVEDCPYVVAIIDEAQSQCHELVKSTEEKNNEP